MSEWRAVVKHWHYGVEAGRGMNIIDRKSVVEGKCVDVGGGRFI